MPYDDENENDAPRRLEVIRPTGERYRDRDGRDIGFRPEPRMPKPARIGRTGQRLLRGLFYLVCVLAVLIVVGGFILPPEWSVEREIIINAAPERVFALIESPKKWSTWAPWFESDPFAEKTYSGPESGVGAQVTWMSSEGTRSGLRITAAIPLNQIASSMDMGSVGRGEMLFTLTAMSPSTTRVTWRTGSKSGFNPARRYVGLLVAKSLKRQCDSGLSRLKVLAEETTPPPNH